MHTNVPLSPQLSLGGQSGKHGRGGDRASLGCAGRRQYIRAPLWTPQAVSCRQRPGRAGTTTTTTGCSSSDGVHTKGRPLRTPGGGTEAEKQKQLFDTTTTSHHQPAAGRPPIHRRGFVLSLSCSCSLTCLPSSQPTSSSLYLQFPVHSVQRSPQAVHSAQTAISSSSVLLAARISLPSNPPASPCHRPIIPTHNLPSLHTSLAPHRPAACAQTTHKTCSTETHSSQQKEFLRSFVLLVTASSCRIPFPPTSSWSPPPPSNT